MSQTNLIFSVAAIAAVLIAGYFVYYLANVATDLYQLKVEMKRDTDDRLRKMMQDVEARIVDRSKWTRDNLREENQRSIVLLREQLEEAIKDNEALSIRLSQKLSELDERLKTFETASVEKADKDPVLTESPEPETEPKEPASEKDVIYIGSTPESANQPSVIAASEAPDLKINKG